MTVLIDCYKFLIKTTIFLFLFIALQKFSKPYRFKNVCNVYTNNDMIEKLFCLLLVV